MASAVPRLAGTQSAGFLGIMPRAMREVAEGHGVARGGGWGGLELGGFLGL